MSPKFGQAKTKKQEFHSSKIVMDISDAYIDKILVFDMSLYRKNEKKRMSGYLLALKIIK